MRTNACNANQLAVSSGIILSYKRGSKLDSPWSETARHAPLVEAIGRIRQYVRSGRQDLDLGGQLQPAGNNRDGSCYCIDLVIEYPRNGFQFHRLTSKDEATRDLGYRPWSNLARSCSLIHRSQDSKVVAVADTPTKSSARWA